MTVLFVRETHLDFIMQLSGNAICMMETKTTSLYLYTLPAVNTNSVYYQKSFLRDTMPSA